MRCFNVDVVYQEVPGEISLAFSCTGCPIHCPGCHSKFLWNANAGDEFTDGFLMDLLGKYESAVTCVLFFGGDWDKEWLKGKLELVKKAGLKTALYTGSEEEDPEIVRLLDYLKTGPFKEELGGLKSATTNQRMVDLRTGEDITYKFRRTA